MNVDKFGLNIFKRKKTDLAPITLPWCHFKLSETNNCLDAQNKSIRNLSTPIESFDASTKEYVDNLLAHYTKKYSSLCEEVTILKDRLSKLEKNYELIGSKYEQRKRNK